MVRSRLWDLEGPQPRTILDDDYRDVAFRPDDREFAAARALSGDITHTSPVCWRFVVLLPGEGANFQRVGPASALLERGGDEAIRAVLLGGEEDARVQIGRA